MEDLAYRRLLDLAYTTELPIQNDIHTISRLINMRDYRQEITDVLNEFFTLADEGWIHGRVLKEMEESLGRKTKAKIAAVTRWNNLKNHQDDAKSMLEQCSPNASSIENDAPSTKNDATHYTLHTTNNTLPIKDRKRASPFVPPSLIEVQQYIADCNLSINASGFIDYYESNGWMVGKNKMKNWQAACRTWEKRNETNRPNNQADNRSRAKRFSDKLDEIAIRSVAENGFTDRVD